MIKNIYLQNYLQLIVEQNNDEQAKNILSCFQEGNKLDIEKEQKNILDDYDKTLNSIKQKLTFGKFDMSKPFFITKEKSKKYEKIGNTVKSNANKLNENTAKNISNKISDNISNDIVNSIDETADSYGITLGSAKNKLILEQVKTITKRKFSNNLANLLLQYSDYYHKYKSIIYQQNNGAHVTVISPEELKKMQDADMAGLAKATEKIKPTGATTSTTSTTSIKKSPEMLKAAQRARAAKEGGAITKFIKGIIHVISNIIRFILNIVLFVVKLICKLFHFIFKFIAKMLFKVSPALSGVCYSIAQFFKKMTLLNANKLTDNQIMKGLCTIFAIGSIYYLIKSLIPTQEQQQKANINSQTAKQSVTRQQQYADSYKKRASSSSQTSTSNQQLDYMPQDNI